MIDGREQKKVGRVGSFFSAVSRGTMNERFMTLRLDTRMITRSERRRSTRDDSIQKNSRTNHRKWTTHATNENDVHTHTQQDWRSWPAMPFRLHQRAADAQFPPKNPAIRTHKRERMECRKNKKREHKSRSYVQRPLSTSGASLFSCVFFVAFDFFYPICFLTAPVLNSSGRVDSLGTGRRRRISWSDLLHGRRQDRRVHFLGRNHCTVGGDLTNRRKRQFNTWYQK